MQTFYNSSYAIFGFQLAHMGLINQITYVVIKIEVKRLIKELYILYVCILEEDKKVAIRPLGISSGNVHCQINPQVNMEIFIWSPQIDYYIYSI